MRCLTGCGSAPASGPCLPSAQAGRWVRIFSITSGCSVKARMEVHEVPRRLDGDDDVRDGRLVPAHATEEGLQGRGGTLTES